MAEPIHQRCTSADEATSRTTKVPASRTKQRRRLPARSGQAKGRRFFSQPIGRELKGDHRERVMMYVSRHRSPSLMIGQFMLGGMSFYLKTVTATASASAVAAENLLRFQLIDPPRQVAKDGGPQFQRQPGPQAAPGLPPAERQLDQELRQPAPPDLQRLALQQDLLLEARSGRQVAVQLGQLGVGQQQGPEGRRGRRYVDRSSSLVRTSECIFAAEQAAAKCCFSSSRSRSSGSALSCSCLSFLVFGLSGLFQ